MVNNIKLKIVTKKKVCKKDHENDGKVCFYEVSS